MSQSPQLILLSDYRDERFPGKKPDPRTLRRAIMNGELPGQKIGGRFWVDVSAEAEIRRTGTELTGNDLVDRVLKSRRR